MRILAILLAIILVFTIVPLALGWLFVRAVGKVMKDIEDMQ